MIAKEITIVNSLGLHARPATFFVQKATAFKCSINIIKGERTINAKSLLGVLSMGITEGTTVELTFDGVDEEQAMQSICNFISTGCGEVVNR